MLEISPDSFENVRNKKDTNHKRITKRKNYHRIKKRSIYQSNENYVSIDVKDYIDKCICSRLFVLFLFNAFIYLFFFHIKVNNQR